MAGAAITTVIFDLGGVLMRNGRPSDVALRFPDHDPALITGLLMGDYGEDTDHPWHRLERGEISLADCRAANRRLLAEAGVTPGAPLPRGDERLQIDFERNEAMLTLLTDLRSAGVRTGMLTNNVAEFRPAWWPLAPWAELFDDIVDSHQVGLRKPNPAIYRLALERLDAGAATTAFLDDVEANVSAATAVGMVGIHVVDDGLDAIAEVRRLAFH